MIPPTTIEQAPALGASAGQSDVDARAEQLLAEVSSRGAGQRLPVASYRLQLHGGFKLPAAIDIVPYLAALGVTDIYASPLLQAMPGSVHGYDVVDHSTINTEIGNEEELCSLANALNARQMGLLMDVVPNHMSADPAQNAWWRDVLENGPSSRFANYFDIDWMPLKPDLAHKVLLPILEDQFGKVLEDGLLSVAFQQGAFWLKYYQRQLPLAPQSWLAILDWRLDALQSALAADDPHLLEYLSILTAIRNLPPYTETDPERLEERHREKETSKRRLQTLTKQSPVVAQFIAENVQAINGSSGEPTSYDRLDQLIDQQAYRLAYWRTATDEINYRRFFDINELAAIAMERPEIFAATHAKVFSWIDEGIVGGLRIDHPDGLFDPPEYLRQLQEHRFAQICRRMEAASQIDNPEVERAIEMWRAATAEPAAPLGRPLYVVVEKILGHGEQLPEDWPVYGTVGYEFLNALGGLFVDPAGEKPLSALFTRFTGESLDFRELEYTCKRLIARMSMASELHVLGYQLDRMSERNRRTRDFTLTNLIEAVQEVVSCFSVYRTYVHDESPSAHDRQYIESAVARAKRRNPAMDASVFDFLRDVLLLRHGDHVDDEELRMQRNFVGKFQQLTGPIMAKSVEDTAFYRFNRLVSLNEVGGEPSRFGNDAAAFHRLNAQRLPRLSHGLSTTTTHDTKRSEDVRARISVLSEVPREWREHVTRWSRWHRRFKVSVEANDAPSRNDEYLLYQSLVGVWPGAIPAPGDEHARFSERLQQYALKVARESKAHTSWINQHQDYEQALLRFVEDILTPGTRRPFLKDLDRFVQRVAEHGYWNSLSQTLLKVASPGVPDFFQGTESWTLTLVDPDNRRPVDFAERTQKLDELRQRVADCVSSPGPDPIEAWLDRCQAGSSVEGSEKSIDSGGLAHDLLSRRADGTIKLFCTQFALRLRRRLSELFTIGSYEPLSASGDHAANLVALARTHADQAVIAVAPRLTVGLTGFGGPPPIGEVWGTTMLTLPDELARRDWCDIFTGRPHRSGTQGSGIALAGLFAQLPFALLVAAPR